MTQDRLACRMTPAQWRELIEAWRIKEHARRNASDAAMAFYDLHKRVGFAPFVVVDGTQRICVMKEDEFEVYYVEPGA